MGKEGVKYVINVEGNEGEKEEGKVPRA